MTDRWFGRVAQTCGRTVGFSTISGVSASRSIRQTPETPCKVRVRQLAANPRAILPGDPRGEGRGMPGRQRGTGTVRRLPSASPRGHGVRPAKAQTRRHRYSQSCVEPSLWPPRRFHRPRSAFEMHCGSGPRSSIDKATWCASSAMAGGSARDLSSGGHVSLSRRCLVGARRHLNMGTDDNGYELKARIERDAHPPGPGHMRPLRQDFKAYRTCTGYRFVLPQKQPIRMVRILGVKTVETHRAAFMKKLGVSSMGELVRYAVRNSVIFEEG